MNDAPAEAHRVVVIGGGFGGLCVVKKLARAPVEITLIDRHNYHLFQPLSYQVATGALSAADIAMPLRHIFRRQRRVTVLLGTVTGFELDRREVIVSADVPGGVLRVPYDTLIVAGGSDYSYFGHDEWRTTALEVKTLDSALEVRGRILHAFEVAELNPAEQESWLTFVVVGAGPTGVEMAGQIAELARDTLSGEFRRVDPRARRVLLVETTDRVLGAFRDPLPRRAVRSLERLGVTPMLDHTVVDVRARRRRAEGPRRQHLADRDADDRVGGRRQRLAACADARRGRGRRGRPGRTPDGCARPLAVPAIPRSSPSGTWSACGMSAAGSR